MPQIALSEHPRTNPLDVVERIAAINDWSFERAGDDEITMLVGGKLERLPGLLHLDARHRGAASGLRLRPQGAGARAARGAAAHRAGERATVGRPFRPVDPGRHGDVPPRAGAGRRRRGDEPAMRGAARPARSKPASAISRRSSSWSGPASRRARRSTPRCSRPRARRKAFSPRQSACHAPRKPAIHAMACITATRCSGYGCRHVAAAMTTRGYRHGEISQAELPRRHSRRAGAGRRRQDGRRHARRLARPQAAAEEGHRAGAAAVEGDQGAGASAASASIPKATSARSPPW